MKLIALPQPNNNKANSTQFGNLMKQTEGHCLCEMRNTSVCFRVLEFNTCPTHMTEWPAARAIKEKPWMADSGHQSESIVFLEKLDLNPSTFPHSIKSGNISEIWLKIWHFVISLMFGFRKRKFFYTYSTQLKIRYNSYISLNYCESYNSQKPTLPSTALLHQQPVAVLHSSQKTFNASDAILLHINNKLLISPKNDKYFALIDKKKQVTFCSCWLFSLFKMERYQIF